MVLALMKPGVTPDVLESELAPLLEGVEDVSPSIVPLVNPLWGFLGDDYIRGLWLVFWGGIALMFVAVLTATNLMLGRADARSSEIAMRVALGASRARLSRLFLAESSVLSAAGMALAPAVAAAAGAGMRMIEPGSLVPAGSTGLAGRALAFATALAVVSAVVCAVVPLVLVRGNAAVGSRSSSGRTTERPSRFRSVVVATQTALAVVLVAGASLMARSLRSMTRVDTGMAIDRLLMASIRLPEDRYVDDASRIAWQERASSSLAALPGVIGVTTSSAPPLSFSVRGGVPFLDGEPEPVLTGAEFVSSASAPPGYFDVLGIPVLQGRAPRDEGAREVVVNHSFARTRQGSVLGRTLRFPGDTIAWTVVGVAGDIRSQGLTDSPDRVQLYFPASPGSAFIRFVLRTEGDPAAVMPSVRSAFNRLDPALPLRQQTTGPRIIREQTARIRFVAALLGGFACLGLVFATGAVYGTTSIEAGRRVREVGLRIALGATTGSVLRRVAFTGLVPVAIGAALGMVAVLWASPVLDSLLFRIDARDPASIAAALAILLGAGLIGSSLPAWRTSRVDPAAALRAD
jgi:predicted permease